MGYRGVFQSMQVIPQTRERIQGDILWCRINAWTEKEKKKSIFLWNFSLINWLKITLPPEFRLFITLFEKNRINFLVKLSKKYRKICFFFIRAFILSYDAMNAHAAIVFVRYMMLSVAQRENEDDKTICELCFCLLDEMEDITFN